MKFIKKLFGKKNTEKQEILVRESPSKNTFFSLMETLPTEEMDFNLPSPNNDYSLVNRVDFSGEGSHFLFFTRLEVEDLPKSLKDKPFLISSFKKNSSFSEVLEGWEIELSYKDDKSFFLNWKCFYLDSTGQIQEYFDLELTKSFEVGEGQKFVYFFLSLESLGSGLYEMKARFEKEDSSSLGESYEMLFTEDSHSQSLWQRQSEDFFSSLDWNASRRQMGEHHDSVTLKAQYMYFFQEDVTDDYKRIKSLEEYIKAIQAGETPSDSARQAFEFLSSQAISYVKADYQDAELPEIPLEKLDFAQEKNAYTLRNELNFQQGNLSLLARLSQKNLLEDLLANPFTISSYKNIDKLGIKREGWDLKLEKSKTQDKIELTTSFGFLNKENELERIILPAIFVELDKNEKDFYLSLEILKSSAEEFILTLEINREDFTSLFKESFGLSLIGKLADSSFWKTASDLFSELDWNANKNDPFNYHHEPMDAQIQNIFLFNRSLKEEEKKLLQTIIKDVIEEKAPTPELIEAYEKLSQEQVSYTQAYYEDVEIIPLPKEEMDFSIQENAYSIDNTASWEGGFNFIARLVKDKNLDFLNKGDFVISSFKSNSAYSNRLEGWECRFVRVSETRFKFISRLMYLSNTGIFKEIESISDFIDWDIIKGINYLSLSLQTKDPKKGNVSVVFYNEQAQIVKNFNSSIIQDMNTGSLWLKDKAVFQEFSFNGSRSDLYNRHLSASEVLLESLHFFGRELTSSEAGNIVLYTKSIKEGEFPEASVIDSYRKLTNERLKELNILPFKDNAQIIPALPVLSADLAKGKSYTVQSQTTFRTDWNFLGLSIGEYLDRDLKDYLIFSSFKEKGDGSGLLEGWEWEFQKSSSTPDQTIMKLTAFWGDTQSNSESVYLSLSNNKIKNYLWMSLSKSGNQVALQASVIGENGSSLGTATIGSFNVPNDSAWLKEDMGQSWDLNASRRDEDNYHHGNINLKIENAFFWDSKKSLDSIKTVLSFIENKEKESLSFNQLIDYQELEATLKSYEKRDYEDNEEKDPNKQMDFRKKKGDNAYTLQNNVSFGDWFLFFCRWKTQSFSSGLIGKPFYISCWKENPKAGNQKEGFELKLESEGETNKFKISTVFRYLNTSLKIKEVKSTSDYIYIGEDKEINYFFFRLNRNSLNSLDLQIRMDREDATEVVLFGTTTGTDLSSESLLKSDANFMKNFDWNASRNQGDEVQHDSMEFIADNFFFFDNNDVTASYRRIKDLENYLTAIENQRTPTDGQTKSYNTLVDIAIGYTKNKYQK